MEDVRQDKLIPVMVLCPFEAVLEKAFLRLREIEEPKKKGRMIQSILLCSKNDLGKIFINMRTVRRACCPLLMNQQEYIGEEINMSKYGIAVREILKRTVIVEAENIEEAVQKVERAVEHDEIILDVDDYDYREIIPSEYWGEGKVPEGEDVSFYWQLEKV